MSVEVSNTLIVTTKSSNNLDTILDSIKSCDSDFDFNKLIPMPDSLDILSGDLTQKAIEYRENRDEKEMADILQVRGLSLDNFLEYRDKVLRNIELYGYPTWRPWREANWGCKLNASNVKITREDNNAIISFNTPNSVPRGIVKAFKRRFEIYLTSFVVNYSIEGDNSKYEFTDY
jgi:hypothetical protein